MFFAEMDQLGRAFFLLASICLLNALALSGEWESLTHIYQTYDDGPGLHHYYNYGPCYDLNIGEIRKNAVAKGTKVRMLEIGVQSGGSTRVWKRYFRGTLAYVGIDINPSCKQFESMEEGIRIEIGSQLDSAFLSNLCSTHGPFDLVVDDGGHTNKMISTSLSILWGCLRDNAVYVIEDLHTLNMGKKWLSDDEKDIFQQIGEWMRVRSPSLRWRKKVSADSTDHPGWHLKRLSFYDSMLFLHYGREVPSLQVFKKGSNWIPRKVWNNSNDSHYDSHCLNCCVGCYDD